jgi:hypothetical protein
MRAFVLCALAACSAEPRGIVTVLIPPTNAPYNEAFVLFQDPDGTTRSSDQTAIVTTPVSMSTACCSGVPCSSSACNTQAIERAAHVP